MKGERKRRAQINRDQPPPPPIQLPAVPAAPKELQIDADVAADKDVKRERAVDHVLLSTCTQHQLRLDLQLDLGGVGGVGHGLVLRHVMAQLCFKMIFFNLFPLCTIAEVVKGKRGQPGGAG